MLVIAPQNELFDNEYISITQEYKDIKLKPNCLHKKKIKYNNPDNFDKVLQVDSSSQLIKIKTPEFKLEYKSKKR